MTRTFFISTLVFISLQMNLPAFAADNKVDTTSSAAPSNTKVKRGLAASGDKSARLNLGMGALAVGGAGNGLSLNPGVAFRATRGGRTWIHFDTGLLMTFTAGTPVAVPITLGFSYEKREGDLRAFFGFSAGAYIGLSASTTGMLMFLRPGIHIPMDTVDLTLEARFGSVNGAFMLNPLANISIAL